ncbi:MAG: phytanoyl-CoA dioxygenase family protein, partial [Alphaproteobacteria bacterium]
MTRETEQYRRTLETDGFVRIEKFYAPAELAPLKERIARIIRTVYAQHMGSQAPAEGFDSEALQQAYMEMVHHDRKLGGLVYDAVKLIPEFLRITASERNVALAGALRGSDFMGIIRGGDGIRIDNPSEETFRAPWHQDYLYQLSGTGALVFWMPLVDIPQEIGPIEACIGSHRDGPRPIYYTDEKFAGTSYGMQLANEEQIINAYPRTKLTCAAGDLLVIDFLTLHRSGFNRTRFPRWSMQLRYLDFNDPHGAAIGWRGGFSQGNTLAAIHPELVVQKPPAA